MSEYETGRCVVGAKAHGASHGYLCDRHFQNLATMLREIEDQAAMLTPVPSMQQRGGTRGGSLASQRSPARLDVIVHTDRRRGTGIPLTGEPDPVGWDETPSVLDVLASWARVVREERDLTADEQLATITSERRVLTTHLDWIAAQEWVDEFHAEIGHLLARLKVANGTHEDRSVGRCWHINGEQVCDGNIRRVEQASMPWITRRDRCERTEVTLHDGHAYCDRCGCTWDGPQLAHLSWQLERAKRPKDENGEPLWSADEIAREHGVKVGTVHVWAHRRGIVSIGGYFDPRAFGKKALA